MGTQMTLNLHNDINEVPLLAEWIDQVVESFDLPMTAAFSLNLALEEAVVNVMNYAYPGLTEQPIVLTAEQCDDSVAFQLIDQGVPFDPTSSGSPDLTLSAEERPIGGLGIFLVNQLMASVQYRYENQSNILTMIFKASE